MLEGGAFSSKEFNEFSKTVVPMLHITTQIDGRKNDDLLGDKAERMAFPSVILMDETGDPLTQVHVLDMSGYKKLVTTAQTYLAAKKKVDGGDATAKVEMGLAGASLGKVDMDELDELLEGATLTDAQTAIVKQLRANAVFNDLMASARVRRGDPEFRKVAIAECKKIYAGGVHPDTGDAYQYWLILASAAKESKDMSLMELATKSLHKILDGNRRATRILKQVDDDLAAMKKAATKEEPADAPAGGG